MPSAPDALSMARYCCHAEEIACDDAVLAAGFDPAHDAEALVATAQHLTATSLIGCPMLNSPTLTSRIARLPDRSLPRTTSTASFRRTAILAAAVFTAIALTHAAPQSQSGAIYKVGHGVSAPTVLFKSDPAYTDQARDAKVEGTVLLSVVVGADGQARDAVVVKGLDPALDSNAITSVYQWRFRPGTKDGQPVAVRARIEMNYRLK
ncbi:MAG: M56 family metallopeptidase [Acidobacteriota bacterium]